MYQAIHPIFLSLKGKLASFVLYYAKFSIKICLFVLEYGIITFECLLYVFSIFFDEFKHTLND